MFWLLSLFDKMSEIRFAITFGIWFIFAGRWLEFLLTYSLIKPNDGFFMVCKCPEPSQNEHQGNQQRLRLHLR